MAAEDTTLAFIVETQIAIFDDARHELQLSIPEIARRAKLPVGTVNAWAQGRNTLSLWGLKKLLRVKELAPLLSRLFAPEEYALVGYPVGLDLDELAADFQAFLVEKGRCHHPESEAGPAIGPTEQTRLTEKAVKLVAVR